MPFTFSHPAAILPLRIFRKNWFSLTALVIGSIVPDFEYFIRMKDDSFFSHRFWGIWWFDLPLAFLLSFLFHGMVRKPLLLNLPASLQKRFLVYMHFDWPLYVKRNLAIVLGSFIVGILSHILWDHLTHETANFIQRLPDVQQHLFTEKRRKISYYLLWYGNSLAGAALVLYFVWKCPVNSGVTIQEHIIDYWLAVCAGTLVIFLLRIIYGSDLFLGDSIVSCISAFLLSNLLAAPLWRLNNKSQPRFRSAEFQQPRNQAITG